MRPIQTCWFAVVSILLHSGLRRQVRGFRNLCAESRWFQSYFTQDYVGKPVLAFFAFVFACVSILLHSGLRRQAPTRPMWMCFASVSILLHSGLRRQASMCRWRMKSPRRFNPTSLRITSASKLPILEFLKQLLFQSYFTQDYVGKRMSSTLTSSLATTVSILLHSGLRRQGLRLSRMGLSMKSVSILLHSGLRRQGWSR